jgi:hypothetical protein
MTDTLSVNFVSGILFRDLRKLALSYCGLVSMRVLIWVIICQSLGLRLYLAIVTHVATLARERTATHPLKRNLYIEA